MTNLTKLIIAAIQCIPKGKVVSYGQIAEIVHHKGSARQVSRTLHTQTKKYNLNWHRVINSKGEISLTGEALDQQKHLLLEEGVGFDPKSRIDFDVDGWHPTPIEVQRIEKLAEDLSE